MANLDINTPVSVAYTGASDMYVATSAGQVTVHMWGGAGAGGYYANSAGAANRYGGAGGYANLRFWVQKGDVLSVEVGQGGQVATGSAATATLGGNGGYPDGGYGGKSSTTVAIGFGGGGGSSRLYKNGELIAVAGGGGGATGLLYGGNGGGISGLPSSDASSGGGGSQTAGGATGSGIAVQAGAYMLGGKGSAVQATAATTVGAGGGGGYYGGGSNGGAANANGSGGGGSGFINGNTEYQGFLKAGVMNSGLPFDVSGIRASGIAEGGNGPTAATSWNLITPGGNGQIYMSMVDPAATATSLPTTGTTTLGYSGTVQVYKVTAFAAVDFEMWGAGGSGGFYTTGGASPRFGGAGGYTKFTRYVYPGDIIEMEVGQGGIAPTGVGGNIGGVGGWPNGGDGGRNSTNANANMGAGGGSTNVYINGRLLAVASGGGGGTGLVHGGNGGGRYGLQDAGSVSNNGTGGTWGGIGSGLNRANYMMGGHGSPLETRDTVNAVAGSGGGGGYFGGGGAKASLGSGGGGCGYVSGDNTYNRVMQTGVAQTGNPFSNGNRPSGVAQGGVCGTTAGTTTNGGDGALLFTVTAGTTSALPSTKTALSFTGAAEHYVASDYGIMSVKLWGGGAAGCVRSSGTPPRGGGGGFAQITTVKIAPGDIVTFVVAEGGKGMPATNTGGRGGFPNGEGGNAAGAADGNGGGGGSSHVYLNGKLLVVAGGGGGGAISFAGGTAGLSNYAGSADAFQCQGASLLLGGYAPQRAAEGNNRGVFMLGGIACGDGATIDTPNNLGGGGGGGGYWGGGGAFPLNSRFVGGGAGTTYISPLYLGTQIQGTAAGSNITDADWVTGVSVGGLGSNSMGTSTNDGGNGLIVVQFDILASLSESIITAVPVTGTVQTYVVGNDGNIVLNAWGGGGGASTITSGGGTERGGGGGYAAATVAVTKGQIVRFYNGRGGLGGQYISGASGAFVGSGGTGGWPDGGNGGLANSCISGGGGGGSRIYVDDVLMMVAGGGGGAGAGSTATTAGGGGGALGGNSDTTTGLNTGGSNFTGGTNSFRPTDVNTTGGPFKGGLGYAAGGAINVVAATSGGGGGGGLFGGGGSGPATTSNLFLGGGGGSGFIADGRGVTAGDQYRQYVLAQYSFESGAVVDDARSINTALLDTAPTITTGPKYGSGCLNINGGHMTMTLPAFGTQDFTIEGWFNPSAIATGVMMVLGNQTIGGFGLFYFPGTTTLGIRFNNAAQASDVTYADTARAANVWAHYAVVRDQTGLRVYKNGVVVITIAGVASSFSATTLTIGNYNAAAGASTRFTGKVDELRVTLGVGRYRNNFNPAPFQNLYTQVPTLTTLTQGTNGVTGQPAGTGVTGYITGRGVGAQTFQALGSAPTGGDGQINYYLATSTVAASGPIGTIVVTGMDAVAGASYPLTAPGTKIVESYGGVRTNYEAVAAGTTRLFIEMWGAGGGGVTVNNRGGGGGGYTTYEVDLNQGDRISVQTASGGVGGNSANTVSPINAGGYPDGGDGYAPAFTSFCGGGGGSSRLYVNGALAAVAGGGGGSAYGSGSSDYGGGPGGGATGGNADINTGGSQSAGGNGSGNGSNGSSLKGGVGGVTPRLANNGPGGGGGYWGGGGGGASTGGGGGSGYVNTGIVGFRSGVTQSGSGNTPAGTTSPNYVAGIGKGSVGVGAQVGGNGSIVISVITPTPAATAGDLGPDITTVPFTTLGFQIGLPVSKPIGTVTVTPMVGNYGFPGFPEMQPFEHSVNILPIESSPTSNALVIVPINDSQSLIISPPAVFPLQVPAEGIGALPTVTVAPPEGLVSTPNAASGDLGPAITLEAPEGFVDVIDPTLVSGDIGTVTIVTVDGEASVNYDGNAAGNVGTVTLTAPTATADPGSPHVIVDMAPAIVVTPPQGQVSTPNAASGDLGPDIVLTAPEAMTGIEGNVDVTIPSIQLVTPLISINTSTGDDVSIYADIGQINVGTLVGEGLEITEANYVDGLPFPLVVPLTAPEGSARGDVEGSSSLPTITVTSVEPFVEVEADVLAQSGDWIILTSPPLPVYDSAANINVAMPSAIVINGNDAEASLDVTVPLPTPINLTAPEAAAQGGYGAELPPPIVITSVPLASILGNATGSPGTVTVTAPDSFVETPAVTSGNLSTVTISPPLGNALGGFAAEGTGSLPTINVLSPQGGNVAEAAVNAPLTTVFLTAPAPAPSTGVTISGPSNTINVTAPVGGASATATGTGDLSIITVVTPEGIGYLYEEGFASGDVGTVTLTAPDASATGAAVKANALPIVTIVAPDAIPMTPVAPSGEIGTIVVTPPEGMGFPDTVTGTGDIGTVVVSPPLGAASVPALIAGAMPPAIVVSAPDITRVNVSGEIGTVQVYAPFPVDISAAVNLARPIDLTISLTAPNGLGYPVIPADAEGDLGQSIVITASDGSAHGDYQMIVALPTIPVTAPTVVATGDALADQQGELPIVVSAPAGEFYREASVVLGLSTIYIFAPNATVDADDKTAGVTADLPVVYIQGVDGFAEVPVVDGTARLRFRRSMTPGAIPATLEAREIAFNEVDGIMYSRDGSGTLRPTPWGTLRRESIPTTIGTAGQAYRADGAWIAPQPVYDQFVQGVPASGVRVALGETFVGQSTRTPASGTTFYSPFFVPRTMAITDLSVDVQTADMGVAQIGICAWNLNRTPGASLIQGSVATTTTGVRSAASTSVELAPGWYAATFNYLGLGAPVFNVKEGPGQIATDFTTQQGTPAFVSAGLQ